MGRVQAPLARSVSGCRSRLPSGRAYEGGEGTGVSPTRFSFLSGYY
jgi:hypothetical protein